MAQNAKSKPAQKREEGKQGKGERQRRTWEVVNECEETGAGD